MNRRDAVRNVAIIMGGALTASTLSVMLDSCNTTGTQKGKGTDFTEDEKKMISRMADVIIPRTDTPGAVDADVPAFIVMMMQECYPEQDQQQFHAGLAAFDQFSKDHHGNIFLNLSADKQGAAVADLDKTVLGNNKKNKKDEDLSFYRKLKELTLLGFFTSESGATKTLRYVQIPGRYDGCVPYKQGEKAWAT